MRKVTKTVTEINTEAGIKLVIYKGAGGVVKIHSYFKEEPIDLSYYNLTPEDAKELANAILELIND